MEKIIKERIRANEKVFTKKELNKINNNDILVEKIYLLGVLDIISGQNSGVGIK